VGEEIKMTVNVSSNILNLNMLKVKLSLLLIPDNPAVD